MQPDIPPEMVASMRERELLLVREADATMVVSDIEQRLLLALVPDAFVVELPLARALRRSPAPFAERRDVGFVGGFAHTPNIDALRWFLRDIWPLVTQAIPDCRFSVVGCRPAGLAAGRGRRTACAIWGTCRSWTPGSPRCG